MLMDSNWLKPNHFVVENGKMIPRSTTPKHKKNYRYIPFQPFNNPTSEDYFRETISRLQKQNKALKSEVTNKIREEDQRNRMMSTNNQSDQVRYYEAQIACLMQDVGYLSRQLDEKVFMLTNKDKLILQLSNQNTRLHLKVQNFVKQIQSLNLTMNQKEQQITSTKEQLEEYLKALESLTLREKEQERTRISDSYCLNTPRAGDKPDDDEDEFYSMQCESMYDRRSNDYRYMTPSQGLKLQDTRVHLNRSSEQPNFCQTPRKSMGSEQSFFSLSNITELASRSRINTFSLQFMSEEIDPLTKGFYSHPSRK